MLATIHIVQDIALITLAIILVAFAIRYERRHR